MATPEKPSLSKLSEGCQGLDRGRQACKVVAISARFVDGHEGFALKPTGCAEGD